MNVADCPLCIFRRFIIRRFSMPGYIASKADLFKYKMDKQQSQSVRGIRLEFS